MMFLLYTFHVLICFFLIAVVLLQQGKGADLSVFGGGATQTAFGARGAASVLHKLTVGSFIFFILTTLAIGVVQSNESSSVIQGLPEEAAVEEEVAPEPEGALPTDDAEAAGDEAEATGDEASGDAAEAGAAEPAADGATPDAEAPDAAGDAAADSSAGDDSASEESGN